MTSKVINFDEIAAEEKELRDSTPPEKKQRSEEVNDKKEDFYAL